MDPIDCPRLALGLLDIQRLKVEIEDPEVIRALELVISQAEEVDNVLVQNANGSKSTDGMCMILSRSFQDVLKQRGLRSTILEGEIELAAKSWLQHYVNIIYLTNYWMVVDFAVSQINKYEGVPVLVLMSKHDKASLKEALKSTYKWWTKD